VYSLLLSIELVPKTEVLEQAQLFYHSLGLLTSEVRVVARATALTQFCDKISHINPKGGEIWKYKKMTFAE
jgi:hypothetical protein